MTIEQIIEGAVKLGIKLTNAEVGSDLCAMVPRSVFRRIRAASDRKRGGAYQESADMRHCVGAAARLVADGSLCAVSIRQGGARIATALLVRGLVHLAPPRFGPKLATLRGYRGALVPEIEAVSSREAEPDSGVLAERGFGLDFLEGAF